MWMRSPFTVTLCPGRCCRGRAVSVGASHIPTYSRGARGSAACSSASGKETTMECFPAGSVMAGERAVSFPSTRSRDDGGMGSRRVAGSSPTSIFVRSSISPFPRMTPGSKNLLHAPSSVSCSAAISHPVRSWRVCATRREALSKTPSRIEDCNKNRLRDLRGSFTSGRIGMRCLVGNVQPGGLQTPCEMRCGQAP